jgi:hypothetical protein
LPNINIGDSHFVLSQSSCLIRANIVRATHNFARCKFFDKILILKHLSDRVGKGDHNS